MATSGYKTTNVAAAAGSYTDGVRLRLRWEELSQSVANNTTKIRLYLQVITGQYGQMIGTAPQTWKITCGGASDSGTWTIQQGDNTTRTIGTLDVTIKHDADGTGDFTASASASFNMNFNGWVGTKSVSGLTGALETIPRASTPSITGSTMGSAIKIKTNRASTSFTHTIKYNFQGHQAIIDEDVGASVTWTPAVETFAPWLTDATQATCTIICNTYQGTKLIGTKEVEFKLKIPSSVVPSISSVTPSDASGFLATYGAYVQNKSSVKVAVSAAGIHGSTIAKYAISMDGLKATANNAVLGSPQNTGERTITATVTDSRGRTATATATIDVAEYFEPSLSSLTAYRVDTSTMEEDDESTTIYAYFDATFCNINNSGTNILASKIEYSLMGYNQYTTVQQWSDTATGSTGSTTASHGITIPNMSEAKAYSIRITATDILGGKT